MPGNGDWTKRYATGDTWQPRAEWLNNVTKAAQAIARNSANQKSGSEPSRRADGLVAIKNGTGADVDRYSILGFNGLVIEPADNLAEFQAGPIFYSDIPNTGDDFVVCAQAIPKDGIGYGFLFGVTACYVDMISATDGYADIKNGDKAQLVSGAAGRARILWVELGTGKKWAVVQIGAGQEILLFKFTSNAAGHEEYNAKSVVGPCTQDAATNLIAPPAGMTLSSTEDLLVLNIAGSGGSGHSIAANTFGAGVVVGTTDESPPRRTVWAFGGGSTSLPTPTALYQVLSVTAFTDTTHFTIDWDWVRGHG